MARKSKDEELKIKWQTEDANDAKYLEATLEEWKEGYDITEVSREVLVRQICYETLNVNKMRQNGEDTSKAVRTLRELIRDSGLTPKKAESVSEKIKFTSLAELIKSCEEHKPFILKDKELEDVDGIRRISDGLSGALMRTLRKKTEEVEQFEEIYKEYTVNIQSAADEE